MRCFFLSVLFFAFGSFLFARDTKTIRAGQYVIENGEIFMISSAVSRYDHPTAARLQPLAHLGITQSFITGITQNASGKWQVVWRVEGEKGAYDVLFQLSVGDDWVLYSVSPQSSYAKADCVVFRVVSISDNAVEVEMRK